MGSGHLSVADGALLGAGMLCVSGAAMFYKQKRTTPFKVAYFLSWPLLGTAILKVWSPNKAEMEQELRQRGLDSAQIDANRRLTAMQLEKLQQVAGEAKADPRWPDATKR